MELLEEGEAESLKKQANQIKKPNQSAAQNNNNEDMDLSDDSDEATLKNWNVPIKFKGGDIFKEYVRVSKSDQKKSKE